MTKFKYKAINEKGDLIQDEIEALSVEEVVGDLSARGYTPVNIKEKSPLPDFSRFFNLSELRLSFYRIKSRELMLFFRQLSALFTAGVPLFESLAALEEQFGKERIREIIVKLREDVAGGSAFSMALARHPKVFSNLMVAMVEAGEKAGIMDEVLKKILAYTEKENQLKQKVRGALRYPVMVMSSLAVGFIFAIIFIIPKFTAIFGAFKTKLPLPTRILLGINYAVVNYWLVILVLSAVSYGLFKLYHGTSSGRRQCDQFLLRLPVFGILLTKISLARFFSMLSAMISSGISIVEGLETTASTADNVVIGQAIMKIRERVISGVTLSDSMREHSLFPPTAVRMVAIGEKSGTLDDMLAKSAAYFDEETDYTVSNLMTLLEPMLIFVMGLFVLLLALGIFLPMWSMMQLYTN